MYQYIEDDGKPIVINRGDTIKKPIFINDGDKLIPVRHELEKDEWLYVAILSPNQKFEDAVVKKSYNRESEKTPFGDTIFYLQMDETEYLEPGIYYIEAKKVLYNSNGSMEPLEVKTVIHRKKFTIM